MVAQAPVQTQTTQVVCVIRTALYTSDRRHCAWRLWERLAELEHPKEKEIWEELRKCDENFSDYCYDRIISELEQLLGVTVIYDFHP